MAIWGRIKSWFGGAFGGGKAKASRGESRLGGFTAADKTRREREHREAKWAELGLTPADITGDTGAHEDDVDDVDAFLYFGKWLATPESSNVAGGMYHEEDQKLTLGFKDGSFYSYQPVMVDLAREFFFASSKGGWVWDELRERGTVYGFQVPYSMISGPARGQRQWMKSEATREAHGKIWPSGEGSEAFPFHSPNKRKAGKGKAKKDKPWNLGIFGR